MLNNFSEKTRGMFDMGGYCNDWEDGRNDADSIHHIMGRCSNSPYNAAPLNNLRNHQPEGRNDSRRKETLPAIHSDEARGKYLKKTKAYLDDIGYVPNENDNEFLNKYKELYD